MKKRSGRSRGLFAIVALAVAATLCTASTAYAASAGDGGAARIGAGAASRSTAASDSPCTFIPAQTCQSTDPTVTLDIDYTGDTSGCTFTWGVEWGDGGTSPNLVVTDPPDGYVQLAQHTYATPGTYSITVLAGVPDGPCTENDFGVQFTLLTPPPQPAPPSPLVFNATYSGYLTPFTHNYWAVAGKWKVPNLDCSTSASPFPLSGAAQWVGLGGVKEGKLASTPLVQVGVQSLCRLASQVVFPVWEVRPPDGVEQHLSGYKVAAGDHMFAGVDYQGGNRYYVVEEDITRKWTWSMRVTTNSGKVPTTAEWIVEAGTTDPLDLADFGSVTFTADSYATGNANGIHTLGGPGSVNPVRLEVKLDGTQLTKVSSVGGAGTFTVTYTGPRLHRR
jgi:Peptidase A4 family